MRFVGDEIREILTVKPCRYCGMAGAKGDICAEGPHFARISCASPSCGRFLDWLAFPKAEAEEKRDRKRSRRFVTRLGEQRCEFCLRHAHQLPGTQKIEVQHVIEKAAGGADSPENLRLYCTACHRLADWVRTYTGHYHLGEEEPQE